MRCWSFWPARRQALQPGECKDVDTDILPCATKSPMANFKKNAHRLVGAWMAGG